ncbi:MAG TPA: phage tail sheath C-terminal domain-containing protein [Polyangiaceae bacterium]
MPVSPTFPGVYIEEVPSGVRPITGVATSIAAFVDTFRRGPLDTPIRIFNLGDFQREFGGLEATSEASYGIQQFFLNGGAEAYVIRTGRGTIDASEAVLRSGVTDLLQVTAGRRVRGESLEDPGSWGDSLRVEVDHATVPPSELVDPNGEQDAAEHFNLTISEIAIRDGRMVVITTEKFLNLTLREGTRNNAIDVVNEGSRLVQLAPLFASLAIVPERPDAAGTQGAALSAAIPADGSTFDVVLDPGVGPVLPTMTATLDYGGASVTSYAALRPFVEAALRALAPGLGAAERPLLAGAVVRLENNRFRVLLGRSGVGFRANARLTFPNGPAANALGLSATASAVVSDQMVALTGGDDGDPPDTASLTGVRANKTGLFALEDVDLFNILCVPAAADQADQGRAFYADAEAYCRERRSFLIVDVPRDTDSLDDMQTWLGDNDVLRDRNAAVYFPRVRVADPLQQNRLRSIGPSGTLAGLYARTDGSRGVWKAPAGTDAKLNGVQELGYVLTDPENGVLNQLGVNCLRNFPVFSNISWGARTLDGADQQASEWKYIPIRRLALFIEESLFRGTKWVVFEPNDEPLWAQIRLNVGAFMQRLFRQGAFQGQTARAAYLVKCDAETTTQADIDLGIVNILVAFAPLKPAEFVIIRIQQLAGQIPT